MGLGGNHVDDGPAGRIGNGLVNITSGFHIYASKCLQI
jgi:hypothetical protein